MHATTHGDEGVRHQPQLNSPNRDGAVMNILKARDCREYVSSVTAAVGAIAMSLVLLTAAATAETYSSNPYKDLESKLSAALSGDGPALKILSVKETEAKGLLEVTLENGLVIYSTPDGDHFVVGDLYAVRKSGLVNLAEEKRSEDRKAQMDAIPVSQMIVFSPEGETRDYVTVFTDVTCFYCQKLHKEVDQLNALGIEVRYLAYPRAGMDSDGARKLATAWCADDQQGTLTKLKSGVALPNNVCDAAPVEQQYQLGMSLGVRGTPAIVTSSGLMIPGYKPAADLAAILGLD